MECIAALINLIDKVQRTADAELRASSGFYGLATSSRTNEMVRCACGGCSVAQVADRDSICRSTGNLQVHG
jgi:hypothetical protein